jgi:hypothetical protein
VARSEIWLSVTCPVSFDVANPEICASEICPDILLAANPEIYASEICPDILFAETDRILLSVMDKLFILFAPIFPHAVAPSMVCRVS